MPNGDISVGLNDNEFLTPVVMNEVLIWNVFNREIATFEAPAIGSGLQAIRNPHFTFHAPNYVHLTGRIDCERDNREIFRAIMPVELMVRQIGIVPWIRAITKRVTELKQAGTPRNAALTKRHLFDVPSEDMSIRLSIDLINSAFAATRTNQELFIPTSHAVLRIRAEAVEAQQATLNWLHQF